MDDFRMIFAFRNNKTIKLLVSTCASQVCQQDDVADS